MNIINLYSSVLFLRVFEWRITWIWWWGCASDDGSQGDYAIRYSRDVHGGGKKMKNKKQNERGNERLERSCLLDNNVFPSTFTIHVAYKMFFFYIISPLI